MEKYGIVNATTLNLRARPTTESEVLRVLARDTLLEIVRDAGFEWLEVKVISDSQRGFVSKVFLRLTDTRPDDQPTKPQPLTGQGEVTTAALNVRSAPSLDAPVLQQVRQGARLNLLERQGDWIKVKLGDGREAFVAAQFINLNPGPAPVSPYLVDNAELMAAPLPSATLIPTQRPGTNEAVIERIWNNYGGLLARVAELLNIPVNTIVAVLAAESGGQVFGPDNRMIIRFEVHIFNRYWGQQNQATFDQHFGFDRATQWRGHVWRADPNGAFEAFHGDQQKEWVVFSFARRLADNPAMLSISMGAPQIMGFNFARLGYKSVLEMFERFSSSASAQLLGVFDFVRGAGAAAPALQALQRRDYLTFASIYNGAGNAQVYSGIIQNYVVIFNRLIASALPR